MFDIYFITTYLVSSFRYHKHEGRTFLKINVFLQFSKTVEDKKQSDRTLRRTIIKSFACNAVVGFQALILIKVNLSASTFQSFVNFLGTPISRNIILRADFTTYFFNLFLCLANK